MIITKIKGGLGNQMFQYAVAFTVSKKNNVEMKIDISTYEDSVIKNSDTPRYFDLEEFKISKEVAKEEEVEKLINRFGIIGRGLRYFRQKFIRQFYEDYHPQILNKKNYFMDGYWQSEKYFKDIREDIIKEFTLKNLSDKYREALNKIVENSVSIHIRRGDLITNKAVNDMWGTPSIEYYKKALEYIKERSKVDKVYFFSDDIDWVKENFDFVDVEKVFFSDTGLSTAEELILMSKCSHNIIPNSTFSWWSAWLNQNPNKIVIAPSKWMRYDDGTHPNIIPESWIRI